MTAEEADNGMALVSILLLWKEIIVETESLQKRWYSLQSSFGSVEVGAHEINSHLLWQVVATEVSNYILSSRIDGDKVSRISRLDPEETNTKGVKKAVNNKQLQLTSPFTHKISVRYKG